MTSDKAVFSLNDFVRESNRIEGILRDALPTEIEAHAHLLVQAEVSVQDLEEFVAKVQPGAALRRYPGFNVQVGRHIAPSGGPEIETRLMHLLYEVSKGSVSPWKAHCEYEDLHPFTDGNGRSGRALWLWHMGGMGGAPLGFLHHFYYQTLEAGQ